MYSSPTTAVGGEVSRDWYTPRQAGLANREAILPSGEPLISNGPENKFEFRYNTSPKVKSSRKWGQRWLRPPPQTELQRQNLNSSRAAVKKRMRKNYLHLY